MTKSLFLRPRSLPTFHDLVGRAESGGEGDVAVWRYDLGDQAQHAAMRSLEGIRGHSRRDRKELLAELDELGLEGDDFEGRLKVLRKAVLDHAEHEEREEFARLRSSLSPVQFRGHGCGRPRVSTPSHPSLEATLPRPSQPLAKAAPTGRSCSIGYLVP
jgi:hypothetical protein